MKSEHSSSKKKRKREKHEDDNGTSSSKKKSRKKSSLDNSIYQNNESFQVKLISKEKDDTGPFLLRFPQGPPPDDILVKGPKGISFQYFKEVNNGNEDKEKVLEEIRASAPNFQVEYKGRNFGSEEESILSMNKYLIGIHNKKDGKLKVIEVPHIFAMKQNVTSYKSEVKSNKYRDLDKVSQRMLLVNAFASSRRKRAFKQSLTNKVNDKTSFGVDSLRFDNANNQDTKPIKSKATKKKNSTKKSKKQM